MKKKLIGAAVISVLLSGCGKEDDKVGDATSALDYVLSGSSGLRPSVLAPRASDGTLKFATETADLANPVSALSTLDGWSTTQPIQLVPSTVTGVTVPAPADADFAAPVAPLYLLELTLDPLTQRPSEVTKVLAYGKDFAVRADAGSLNLVPLKPLNPSSYYMIVATDALKDSRGTPLKAGGDYSSFKSAAGATAQEQAINGLITRQESLFKSATGITSDRVIFSDWFATQSGADVLLAVKGAAAMILQASPDALDAAVLWKKDAHGAESLPGTYTLNKLDNVGTPYMEMLQKEKFLIDEHKQLLTEIIPNNEMLNAVAENTKVFSGTVRLPYFLSTPKLAGSWEKASGHSWRGATDSLYAIVNAIKAGDQEVIRGLKDAGVDHDTLLKLAATPSRKSELLSEMRKLVGVELTSGGKRLDSERNIGRYSPLPELREVQDVPLRVFSLADDLSQVDSVLIYQHGVTSVKENTYALALSQLLTMGAIDKYLAVVVIDHPLHGERGFALGGYETVTTDANPEPYLNLNYLTVARDNLKQSVADVLGLRLAVGLANKQGALGKPGMKVNFIGHSLGAITGVNLLAVSNQPTGNDAVDELFRFDVGGLAMPGGGLAHMLVNSPSFGDLIKHKVQTKADQTLKGAFDAYAPGCQVTPLPSCFVNEFLPQQDSVTQARAGEQLKRYTHVAQSVLDSADPINLGAGIAKDFSLLVTEVVGDGALNLPDQVIPNRVKGAPLGGTEPLLAVLGVAPLTNNLETPLVRHVGRFTQGGHSSLLAPDGADKSVDVIVEMQFQYGSFFTHEGRIVNVLRPDMLKQD